MRVARLALAAALLATAAAAHPGSGIVLGRKGDVYFIDTGAGVWKVDADGVLTKAPGPNFHWMALDPDNKFAKTPLPTGANWELSRSGASPTILAASDFPITMGTDGNLYYPAPSGNSAVQVMRLTPAGQASLLARLPVGWLNGLAAGPDGSIYATENNAIRKIDKSGRVTTVLEGRMPAGCVSIPGIDASEGPDFRGLDVGSDGSVVVAASGCGSVLKVEAGGKVTGLLQLQAPWSPTAVARSGNDLYVLEYKHTAGEDRKRWLPRVRKISSDGKGEVIATVERP